MKRFVSIPLAMAVLGLATTSVSFADDVQITDAVNQAGQKAGQKAGQSGQKAGQKAGQSGQKAGQKSSG